MMYRQFIRKKEKSRAKNYVCIQQTTAKPPCHDFLSYISVYQNQPNKANERNIKLNHYR